MDSTARVVVIGGGIHGAALLYHLTLEGWSDVLLVEKGEPTSGSTWHAAGQITRSVGDYTTAAFADYAIETYRQLPEITGRAVSLHQPGGLRVAFTELELDQLKSQLGVGRYLGYPIELVSPTEAAEINPFYDFSDALGAIWTEGEAHVDPTDATMAFLAGARANGATVSRRNRVLEVNQLPTGEWSVVTEQGTVSCEHVVDAAGCYAHQVGMLSGSEFIVPQANVLHHYLVTEEVPEFAARAEEMPVMRDNRTAGYIRQEQTAGLIGIYETRGAETIWDDGVPWEAENKLFPADFDKIAPWLEEAFNLVPILAEVGIKRVIHGAITHTTDSHMLLGPAPGLRNYWLNTGSSIGLAWGPGAGRELARWIVHGTTELSLRHYDPRRFAWATPEYIRTKSIEDYEWMFRVHAPGEERLLARPMWTSSLHDTLTKRRAIHTTAYGWEQPKWFVPDDQPLADAHGWRRPEWFEPVREECRAVRERVGVMDLSAFAKYEFAGPDAAAYADWICTGTVPRVGRIALNYVLTEQARVETEVTLSRLADDLIYAISGPVGHQRDLDWFTQHITGPDGTAFDVTITDCTRDTGVLVVAGPNARPLLQRCAEADTSFANDDFRFQAVRTVRLGGVELRALRIGFTGSRGWELHVPMGDMPTVYQALWDASGTADHADGLGDLGLADFGSHALNSLRMEKGYLTRFELTHDIGPRQAGVDRWLKVDKGPFVGSDAIGPAPSGDDWQLVYLDVDVPDGPQAADCVGGEGVFHGETPVGITTSGGYGYTVARSLAFAYVSADLAAAGTELSVLILGEQRPARVLDGPVWDPDNQELLG
ncbi:MAG: FAD-dependent oxidoreductase [Actinomycetota bacterium]